MYQLDRRRVTYYGILVLGAALIGIYFAYVWRSIAVANIFTAIFLISGLLFVLSAFASPSAKSRKSRIVLTGFAGATAGIHAYLEFILFTGEWGTILFSWLGLGILLSFSTFSWLRE